MAQTKYEKIMGDFQADVAKRALDKLDKEAIATQLSAVLKQSIVRDVKRVMESRIKLGEMILSDLRNPNTKTGRNFQGALDEISQNMIKSLKPE